MVWFLVVFGTIAVIITMVTLIRLFMNPRSTDSFIGGITIIVSLLSLLMFSLVVTATVINYFVYSL